MQRFEVECEALPVWEGLVGAAALFAQGLFGYISYDAIPLIEKIKFKATKVSPVEGLVGTARYRLYQYVIAINHYKDELLLLENKIAGMESEAEIVESLINSKDVPMYPFKSVSEETSNMTDEEYVEMVKKGIAHCYRGDVFQIVLSRRFQQSFIGDEFNVYRALRHINPSPYLFFFDYGDYKLMGSSPEAQLVIKKALLNSEVGKGKAIVHPIAGTFKRTGDDETDHQKAEELLNDAKENAEHVMLVDLGRNDLRTIWRNVEGSNVKKIEYY